MWLKMCWKMNWNDSTGRVNHTKWATEICKFRTQNAVQQTSVNQNVNKHSSDLVVYPSYLVNTKEWYISDLKRWLYMHSINWHAMEYPACSRVKLCFWMKYLIILRCHLIIRMHYPHYPHQCVLQQRWLSVLLQQIIANIITAIYQSNVTLVVALDAC